MNLPRNPRALIFAKDSAFWILDPEATFSKVTDAHDHVVGCAVAWIAMDPACHILCQDKGSITMNGIHRMQEGIDDPHGIRILKARRAWHSDPVLMHRAAEECSSWLRGTCNPMRTGFGQKLKEKLHGSPIKRPSCQTLCSKGLSRRR